MVSLCNFYHYKHPYHIARLDAFLGHIVIGQRNLHEMAHRSQNEVKKLNWLPISDRINRCVL